MTLEGKTVAILGAGTSGLAAARLAADRGATVAAFDSGDPVRLSDRAAEFEAIGVELVSGDRVFEVDSQFDLAVVSPGIDLESKIAVRFGELSGERIGEVELAYRLRSDWPVIAITGTNGKTTTTSLVAEMLTSAGLQTVAAGNIGHAYCDVVREFAELDWVVLEVSSFQLESVVDFAPRVAVWMNFAPDHMDRYRTVEDYREAKRNIFRNIDGDSIVIRKWEDEVWDGPAVTFSAFSSEAEFVYDDGRIRHRPTGREFPFRDCHLHGRHNAENVMVALAVADELQLSWNTVAGAIENFRAPAHRCEKIRTLDGVTYVNDSKSTNLHSLESALAGLEERTILIVGGKEKGLDFSSILPLPESVSEVVCIGEIGTAVADSWSGSVPAVVAASLEEAVSLARQRSQSGDVVLFSPGTSSFDMFASYEARGDAFRSAVESLEPS